MEKPPTKTRRLRTRRKEGAMPMHAVDRGQYKHTYTSDIHVSNAQILLLCHVSYIEREENRRQISQASKNAAPVKIENVNIWRAMVYVSFFLSRSLVGSPARGAPLS